MANRIDVKVDGADSLRAKLGLLSGRIRAGAEAAVGAETEALAGDMRNRAPVATGELRDSIQAEHEGLSGQVAATARHATHVNFGTSSHAEQPFATEAAEESRQRWPGRLREAIGGEIKDVAK